MELNFTDLDLEKIDKLDNETKLTQSWETQQENGFPYNLYKVTCVEDVKSFQIKWVGYSSQPFMGSVENEVTIYLYQPDGWNKEIYYNWTESRSVIELDKNIQNISDYIFEGKYVFILITGSYGAGNSTSTLSTDLLEIEFT